MKKSALFLFAAVLSANALASYSVRDDVRAEPQIAHGKIPSLQAVQFKGFKTPRNHDTLKWKYVGEHTPANLTIEKHISDK
ncbi:hypothetical protein [Alysiella filiformis]|uniref:Uncharacterized protein n=1 Tax=Alysiella filiformis DSM 16848 TaxID=1120981 RepID=A0A286EEE1_9NEIS|nr:hypothetical protein [Alysiella filiformis]QMT31620.1 hypothetical protein H3L97_01535 [Alysiella filiformis]UBQ55368.1 hypothetical protein JF568_07140 [Alysiella filiformis DSM 16848]SOD69271.1 hypothetical protein SAMN02746062_01597 [Alysiella filiformis DSM 16848]